MLTIERLIMNIQHMRLQKWLRVIAVPKQRISHDITTYAFPFPCPSEHTNTSPWCHRSTPVHKHGNTHTLIPDDHTRHRVLHIQKHQLSHTCSAAGHTHTESGAFSHRTRTAYIRVSHKTTWVSIHIENQTVTQTRGNHPVLTWQTNSSMHSYWAATHNRT